jgi:hypothetical protein
MKLVMTLLVKDEEDILEANLDYHLAQGIDHIIVTDNNSTDRTGEILASYQQRGLVTVINEPEKAYNQAKWVTKMARLAYIEHNADWVINSDADEFWWPLSGNIKTILETIPSEYSLVDVPRINFLPRPQTNENSPFYLEMVFRDVVSEDDVAEHHDRLQGKVCHRSSPDIEVQQGNHRASAPGFILLENRTPLVIFHFPLRSYSQFEKKIVNGGQAYEESDLPENMGAHWREQYKLWQKGELSSVYQQKSFTDEEIATKITEGEAIRDLRLASFLARLQDKQIVANPPALNVISAGDDYRYDRTITSEATTANPIIIAYANELAADPEMLKELAEEFGSDERVSLVIYAPDALAEEAASLIGPLIQEAGFPDQGGADLQLLAVSSRQEEAIASHANALFSNQQARGAFRRLPCLGKGHASALRTLVFSSTLVSKRPESIKAKKTALEQVMDVEGQIFLEEAEMLMRLASQTEASKAIVEIGSFRGRSTVALALGAQQGNRSSVYAIDPQEDFIGVKGGHYGGADRHAFMEKMVALDTAHNVRLINLPSQAVGKVWDKEIGLLWLDGDHSYEGVKADYEIWKEHLADTGLIAFHDSEDIGPQKVIEEALASGEFEFVEKVASATVLRRRS